MNKIQVFGNIVKKGVKKLPYIKPKMTDLGTRQFPEYLYHFTSTANADKIIKSGKLIAKDDHSNIDIAGVFMLDLENFINNWTKLTIGNQYGSFNFFNMLICQAAKGEKQIACFRIPTRLLDKKILIRDQVNAVKAGKAATAEEVDSLMSKLDDADLYKIYNQKGHAIEFIHPGDIKVSRENLVGITEMPNEFQERVVFGDTPKKSAFDTLKYLFVKQPEAKILEVT